MPGIGSTQTIRLGLLEQRTRPGSSEKQCIFHGLAMKAVASVDRLDALTGDRYI
jgi:hypothetical protein